MKKYEYLDMPIIKNGICFEIGTWTNFDLQNYVFLVNATVEIRTEDPITKYHLISGDYLVNVHSISGVHDGVNFDLKSQQTVDLVTTILVDNAKEIHKMEVFRKQLN